jgi:ankyrin repeat protein
MSFQISGFGQFFQNLFETAPPQPLAVPQRGATLEEIRDFVKSLKLPADLRNQLVVPRLPLFARFFRARGIDPNDEGACTRFTKDFLTYFSLEFLLSRNSQGMTPLMCAIKEEDYDFVKDLIKYCPIDGETLTFAIRNNVSEKFLGYLFSCAPYRKGDMTAMGQLFDSFCLLAKQDRPLAIYCLKHLEWSERFLVHDAAQCGHAAIIPILKDAGFDLDKFSIGPGAGFTPLMDAIMRGPANRKVVEALLAAGATADIVNMSGDSPLTCAYDADYKAIAMLLIRHGAPSTPTVEKWINSHDEQT